MNDNKLFLDHNWQHHHNRDFRVTGYIPKHGAAGTDEILARKIGKLWKTYEAEHIWGYSHYHGGQTHHIKIHAFNDLSGFRIEAETFEALLKLLADNPALKQDRVVNTEENLQPSWKEVA